MNIKSFRVTLFFTIVLIKTISSAHADVIDDAYHLCNALEATGATSECEVKGWGSTVDATIDTNSSQAKQLCGGVAKMMSKQTNSFSGKWKLRIFSPFSGNRPIASCVLK